VTGISPSDIALTDFFLRRDNGHPRVLKVLGNWGGSERKRIGEFL
jgi:hypothetical protein